MTERFSVKCSDEKYFVRPTLFCSGQGLVIAERSLAVINIDLREGGGINILKEQPLPHCIMQQISLSYVPDSNLFDPYLSKSLCFSVFQLTLPFLEREKNSFLLLRRKAQKSKSIKQDVYNA